MHPVIGFEWRLQSPLEAFWIEGDNSCIISKLQFMVNGSRGLGMSWELPKIEDTTIRMVADTDWIIDIKSISREDVDSHKVQVEESGAKYTSLLHSNSDIKGGRSFTINKDSCGHSVVELPDNGQNLGGQPIFQWLSRVGYGWQCQRPYIGVWRQMKSLLTFPCFFQELLSYKNGVNSATLLLKSCL